MNVFLSWSGSKSKAIAEILQKYLPSIINRVKPWLSAQHIDAGARWSAEIAKSLESSNIGILCVTADNQNAPWILFEAGAISKLTASGLAIVLRIDLKASEVVPPLGQFQSIGLERDEIWKMITTINKAGSSLISETTLRTTFDALWNQINAEIEEALNAHASKPPATRSDREMIEEVLALVRSQDAANQRLYLRLTKIDKRLENDQLDSVLSAGAYNGLYGQPANNPLLKPFSALDLLRSVAKVNTIYAEVPPANVPRREAAAADQDIEHDNDDNKNE
jgi:hypothetical protein